MTRLILLTIISISLIGCQEANNKQNDQKRSLNVTNDTLQLREILSFNSLKNTHLLAVHDSVFFITPDPGNNPVYCSITTFSYDSSKRTFCFKQVSSTTPYAEVRNGLLKSSHPDIYIKSIGEFENNHTNLKNAIKNETQLEGLVKAETLIQMYNGEYYLIDKAAPKLLYRYNPITQKLATFTIRGNIMDVIGFFLYDIEGDGNPEVFIFNVGIMPREDVVSYTVNSLRRDSVTVEYK